jgi:hypothetical protein
MGITVNFFEHVSLTSITGLIRCFHGIIQDRLFIMKLGIYYGKLKIKGKRELSGNY